MAAILVAASLAPPAITPLGIWSLFRRHLPKRPNLAHTSQPTVKRRELQAEECTDQWIPPHSTQWDYTTVDASVPLWLRHVSGLQELSCTYVLHMGGSAVRGEPAPGPAVCNQTLGELGFVSSEMDNATLDEVCGRSCAQLRGEPCAPLVGWDAVAEAGRTDDLCECFQQPLFQYSATAWAPVKLATRCSSVLADLCAGGLIGDIGVAVAVDQTGEIGSHEITRLHRGEPRAGPQLLPGGVPS